MSTQGQDRRVGGESLATAFGARSSVMIASEAIAIHANTIALVKLAQEIKQRSQT